MATISSLTNHRPATGNFSCITCVDPSVSTICPLLASCEMPVSKISSQRESRAESIDVQIEGPYHDGDGEVEGHHGAQDGHHVVRLHELDIALVFGNLTGDKNIQRPLKILTPTFRSPSMYCQA